MSEKLIPQSKTGFSSDIVSEKLCSNVEEAKYLFRKAKQRFLNIGCWKTYAGKATADFSLTDATGTILARKPVEGDYFKINIPGPANAVGNGEDWVRIEEVQESESVPGDHEQIIIKVRPAPSPVAKSPAVTHFFGNGATSTFVIQRTGKRVSAEVHGRNEKPNIKVPGLWDKIRNFLVGLTAPAASHIQWKALMNGLLEN